MDPYRSCEESEDHGRLRWVLLREVGFEARLWHAGSSSGSHETAKPRPKGQINIIGVPTG
jgi:hypothetical protein